MVRVPILYADETTGGHVPQDQTFHGLARETLNAVYFATGLRKAALILQKKSIKCSAENATLKSISTLMSIRSKRHQHRILVTGGNGYIGSHTVVELSQSGFSSVIYDDFSTSKRTVAQTLSRRLCHPKYLPELVEGSVLDENLLVSTLNDLHIDSVIHFAGFKSVGESILDPIKYASVNIGGLATLLRSMSRTSTRNLVFSSSCTVYGNPQRSPLRETDPCKPINPYGHSKMVCEQILQHVSCAEKDFRIAVLRYFNPIGAHPSGLIFDDPLSSSPNIIPRLIEVGSGRSKCLEVFGSDYQTKDGSPVRDYIHVSDVARAHVFALEKLMQCRDTAFSTPRQEPEGTSGENLFTVNIGLGRGLTVLELVAMFGAVNNVDIPVRIRSRRQGDADSVYCDTTRCQEVLPAWKPIYSIADACRHAFLATSAVLL